MNSKATCYIIGLSVILKCIWFFNWVLILEIFFFLQEEHVDMGTCIAKGMEPTLQH